MIDPSAPPGDLADEVRVELFRTAAATGRVLQAPELARALGRAEAEVRAALRELAAALDADAAITAPCGDCGARMEIAVRAGRLARSEGVVHFAVPARRWWDNIGFT